MASAGENSTFIEVPSPFQRSDHHQTHNTSFAVNRLKYRILLNKQGSTNNDNKDLN